MITNKAVCIIQRGKQKSTMLASAVAAGMEHCRVFYGDSGPFNLAHDETPVIIGTHPTTCDLLHDFRQLKRPFVVIDNGYLKGYKEGGYFRATTNAMQWIGGEDGRRRVDRDVAKARFHALNLPMMKDWREPTDTGHILLIQQSPVWYEMMGIDMEAWTWLARNRLRQRTDREIIVRHKPLKGTVEQPTLEEHFDNCAAVVGLSSCAMIKAVLEGIQVFPLAKCAASAFSSNHLGDIDFPATPRRLCGLYDLAANQWTADEIASGLMWDALRQRYDDNFYELS